MAELQTEFKKSFNQLGKEITEKLRMQAQLNSLSYGSGLPLPDKLIQRSGRMLRLLVGSGARSRSGSISDVTETADGVHIVWGVESPDIALHEFGGFRPVTPAMRKFYWAKYFTDPTRKQMWKQLALFKQNVRYPARRPIQWAVNATKPFIEELIKEYLAKVVKIHQQILVSGIKKATPINYYQE